MFYLLRYAEIGLKGKNRAFFERLLIRNLKKLGKELVIRKVQGRILVQSEGKLDFKRVFGLASYSPAVKTKPDPVSIAEKAVSLRPKLGKFRVSCQRVDKRIPLKSIHVEKEVGGLLAQQGGVVDLKNFDTEIFVELVDGSAFVFVEKVACFGGLPVGSQSRVGVLLRSARDVLAGLLALKRGCSLLPIRYGFVDAGLLERFGAEPAVKLDDLDGLDKILDKNGCLLLYSGMPFDGLSDISVNVPVVMPLVFYSEEEIETELSVFEGVA